MILFDIDRTISPPRPEEFEETPGETAYAFGFDVFIPTHLLNFLRERDDIGLLSTWGEASAKLADAFDFSAAVILMEDYSNLSGIEGKFEAVKALKPRGWADDHMKPKMRSYAKEHGILTIIPKSGYITERELKLFISKLK
jgi:hypothetical protein